MINQKTSHVISLFDSAHCRADFDKAERLAARLNPLDQLHVVDALRAAEARLELRS